MPAWKFDAKGKLFCIFGVVIGLSFCSHSYYYLPEINRLTASPGEGGSVVFQIPARGPAELLLKVRALGFEKVQDAQFLGMRLSFTRPKGAVRTREFLKPEDQILRIGGQRELHAVFVHAQPNEEKVIDLTGRDSEVVELLFPLTMAYNGAADIAGYSFRWRVRYGENREESQEVKFDRYDTAPRKSGPFNPQDPEFPSYVSPVQYPGSHAMTYPYWWWALDPWWPWWR